MIIRQLTLSPFAGTTDRTVEFLDGLNVVLGPNEAGKSTLVNALRLALFVRTKLHKPEFRQRVEPFMPLSGGDTIQVGASFEVGGHHYELEKAWGGTETARLVLPAGNPLTNEEAVTETLKDLLGLNEGTYASVLIAYQTGLANTLKALSEDRQTSHDLTAILRQAVMETDGVSVGRLGEVLEHRIRDVYQRWDRAANGPEKGRGIESPWKKGVGKVLKAFYAKEEVRTEWERAEEYEDRADRLNQRLRRAQLVLGKLERYIEKHAPIAKDAQTRVRLKDRQALLKQERSNLRKDMKDWPTAQKQLKKDKKAVRDLKNRHNGLEEELEIAEEHERSKDSRRVFEQARKSRSALQRAKKELAPLLVIEDRAFEELERLHTELDRLRTSLEAGKLSVSFAAKRAQKLAVTRDFDDQAEHSVAAGKSLQLSAGGRLGIQHEHWELNVESGDVSIEQMSQDFERLQTAYLAALEPMDASDYAKAKKSYGLYSKARDRVTELKDRFEEALEGEDYDELRKLAQKKGDEGAPRPSAEIGQELGKTGADRKQARESVAALSHRIEEWVDKYESVKDLQAKITAKSAEVSEVGRKLKQLEPLPENVGEANKFLEEFQFKEQELNEIRDEYQDLRVELATLRGNAPKTTAEELQTVLQEAQLEFDQTLAEGQAVTKILDLYRKFRASSDDSSLDPWLVHLEQVISPLTADRYRGADILDSEEARAVRIDGSEMPFDALSIGTKVGVGLAVRLAMARYFLEGRAGFIVLDDPLVDLDPERQKAASRVIQEFSKEKQAVVLTCHPRHARLLGGNLIEIGFED